MSKRMLLIINPTSGVRKKADVFKNVEEIIKENGWNVDTRFTEGREHATEIARESSGYDRIVCMGGDGTLNEVCNGLMELSTRPELGYIPAGSTNDFARGFGIPRSPKKSAKLACSDKYAPIDIGYFKYNNNKGKYFSYVASFGIFTQVAYNTNQSIKNVFGHLAYIFEGIKCMTDLQNYKPFHLKIEYGKTVVEDDYIFGAVTNSTSLGGLMKLDKKTVMVNDGKFELLLIKKPDNILSLTETMRQLMNHKYKEDRIIFEHIESIKLSSEIPLNWTLDGEFAGNIKTAEINVKNNAINFIRETEVRKKPFFKKVEI